MKITKTRLKQIIKEEVEAVIKENEGRPVLALFVLKKPEPKIPGAGVGDLVVLNKEVAGKDGKKYARYSVYQKGQKVRYKAAGGSERVMSIPDDIAYGYAKTALNSGISGEDYIVEMEKLEQHPGQYA
jgi:hypothetical protein